MGVRAWLLVICGMLLTGCNLPPSAATHTVAAPLSLAGDTNPQALSAAEEGALGKPTIVFFHATWCHICQNAKPIIEELAAAHREEVAIVRMDIDDPTARPAVTRYHVSATPTFVLFSAQGDVLATIPGWPGKESMEKHISLMVHAMR